MKRQLRKIVGKWSSELRVSCMEDKGVILSFTNLLGRLLIAGIEHDMRMSPKLKNNRSRSPK